MDNSKNKPELAGAIESESLPSVESSQERNNAISEQRELKEQAETKEKNDNSKELQQIGSITATLTAGDDTNNPQAPTSTPQVLDIPGRTPEEKILHLLNEYPVEKAKEVIDELEDPQHFGESKPTSP